MKLLFIFLLIGFIGCAVMGPNLNYKYPADPKTGTSCEGIGIINNMDEGTDKITQMAIMLTGIEVPRARDDLIIAFEDFNALTETAMIMLDNNDISTTMKLAQYFRDMVSEINTNYVGLAVMFTPDLNAIFQKSEFSEQIPLGYCDFHRLNHWGKANLKNLRSIK